jgi:hypothetical protein
MNLVERWFAELTNRKLRRSAHRSVTELEADIRKWINEWNKDPKPFVWTKTADEILETLAAYCERITDSGHSVDHHGPEVGAPPFPARAVMPDSPRWYADRVGEQRGKPSCGHRVGVEDDHGRGDFPRLVRGQQPPDCLDLDRKFRASSPQRIEQYPAFPGKRSPLYSLV